MNQSMIFYLVGDHTLVAAVGRKDKTINYFPPSFCLLLPCFSIIGGLHVSTISASDVSMIVWGVLKRQSTERDEKDDDDEHKYLPPVFVNKYRHSKTFGEILVCE